VSRNFLVGIVVFFLTFFWGYAQVQNSGLGSLDSAAFAAFESGDYDLADSLANQVIIEHGDAKPSIFSVNAFTLLGIINKNRGFYVSSIEYYIKALNEAEALNDLGRVSACLNNIGSVYRLQADYNRAIDYFKRSLLIEEKIDAPLQLSIRYFNLGECYMQLDSLDLALSFFNNSVLIEEKYKNNEGALYAYLGIIEVYLNMDAKNEASRLLEKVANRIPNSNSELRIIQLKLQGEYWLKTGRFDSAIQAVESALNFSRESNIRNHEIELWKLKIAAFKGMNNLPEAVKAYEQYVQLIEELNASKIKNKIDELAYQNELYRKQVEIEVLKEERQLADENRRIENQIFAYNSRMMYFLFASLIILIVLVIFGLRRIFYS
jgi:tetratricopeptide (TPR) repeat protein